MRRKLSILSCAAFSFLGLPARANQETNEGKEKSAISAVYEHVSDKIKEEVAIYSTGNLLEKHGSGFAAKYGALVLKRISGPVGLAIDVLTPTPAGLDSDIVSASARNVSQCDSAAKYYSEYRYVNAVWDIQHRHLKKESEMQMISDKWEFWILNRKNDNAAQCRLWFESGRQEPFHPS